MMTDELKQIYFSTKSRFDNYVKNGVLKRSLNKNLSIIKNFSKGKTVLTETENSKWLKDNSLFIQNVGKSVLFERVKISEGFLDFLEQILTLKTFSGNQ